MRFRRNGRNRPSQTGPGQTGPSQGSLGQTRPGLTSPGQSGPGRTRAVPSGAAFVIPGMVLAMVLAGCAGRPAASPGGPGQGSGTPASAPHQASATATATAPPSPAVTGPTGSPRAAAIVTSMTLAQKVGQLLVPTVPGLTAADGGAELIRRYHLGGVIYFGQNVRDAAQVAALSAGLQQAARSQPPHLPLLIGTDQEGGIVSRLAGVTTVFPGQMAAGATRDPALIRAQDQATGAAMRALGVNLDYAPVADVNVDPANPVIGIRSFGADPALVATMTAAAVDGFHQAGEVTVAKHFPGHGDTGVDSHTGLPVIHHTLRQWWAIDAPPFQAAIRAGVDEIMIGHIEVPALDDSGQPASLSRKVVTGLLRDRLGYQGVIVTDSLQMGGVLLGHTPAQIAVQAVQAGCDQLLMPADPGVAYHAILRAVRRGQISPAQLDAAVTRVVSLKVARGLLASRPSPRPPWRAHRTHLRKRTYRSTSPTGPSRWPRMSHRPPAGRAIRTVCCRCEVSASTSPGRRPPGSPRPCSRISRPRAGGSSRARRTPRSSWRPRRTRSTTRPSSAWSAGWSPRARPWCSWPPGCPTTWACSAGSRRPWRAIPAAECR